jgi:D-alanyl-D-alanine-carboxypeptidase/D-alanyl-D-alanine-endopeptidase
MSAPPAELHSQLDEVMRAIVATDKPPTAVLAATTNGHGEIIYHGEPFPHEHTTYEIGSLTKTFTALLFADMAHRGEVGYHDPIRTYLPSNAIPHGNLEASVTLVQLATHTSGLPALPANLEVPTDPVRLLNPYAHYQLEDLYHATANLQLIHPPGNQVSYSNFGIGLLGQLLANAAGRSYPDLIRDRICMPLGMFDTTTTPGPTCATGHQHGQPTPSFQMRALAAAGVLRSSPRDLMCYLHAQLNPDATPLAVPLRAVQQPRMVIEGRRSICLVWNHRRFRFGDVHFHSGGTAGFTTFIGFSPTTATGVLALTNTAFTTECTLTQSPYNLLKSLAKM